MADDPVDVIKTAYAAFAAGDIPTVLGLLDSEVEWIETEAEHLPVRGTKVGPDQVLKEVYAVVPDYWEEFQITPYDYFSDGDTVIARGHVKATAKATGTSMDAPFVHIFSLRNGKVVRLTNHHDTAVWRQTLGL